MKKQTKTYLLLGFVLLIWGIIGFKLLGALSSKPEQSNIVERSINFTPKAVKKKDTFSLVVNYRDPFLGTLPTPTKKNRARKIVPKDPEPEIKIEYTGLVQDKDTKERIFFLTIEGQPHLMSPQR